MKKKDKLFSQIINKPFKIGQRVNVKCPVYHNGRKFEGIVTSMGLTYYMIKIEGNSKSTRFADCWVEQLKTPHFSPLTKAMFSLK